MMTTIRISAFLFILFAFPLHAADWTMFHGQNGRNMSPDTGLLTSWLQEGPELLWYNSSIGYGYSSITVQGGRIFTSGNREGRHIVFCLDLEGNQLWEYDNGLAWTRHYPGTRTTPTIDGDFVFDMSPHGYLVCLRVETGEKVWRRNILTDFEGENIIWGLSESIRIDDDKLFCAPGGNKTSLVALNKHTGETIWMAPSLGSLTGYGTSIIFDHKGLRMIVTTYARGFFGVNAANGELLFRFRHEQGNNINATRPIFHEGYLFLTNTWQQGGEGSVMLRLTAYDGNVSLEEVWRNRDLDSLHDNVILLDGFLYGVSYGYRGGVFMCLDWKTGETQFEGQRVGGGSSLTWAEGLVYLFSDQGDVLLIRPHPERFEVISRFSLPGESEGHFWAHPVVIGQRLYIRHGTFLFCFNIAR